MSSSEHLHSLIGKAISERKKGLYKSLSSGADLKVAIAQFMLELQRALSEIVSRSEGGAS